MQPPGRWPWQDLQPAPPPSSVSTVVPEGACGPGRGARSREAVCDAGSSATDTLFRPCPVGAPEASRKGVTRVVTPQWAPRAEGAVTRTLGRARAGGLAGATRTRVGGWEDRVERQVRGYAACAESGNPHESGRTPVPSSVPGTGGGALPQSAASAGASLSAASAGSPAPRRVRDREPGRLPVWGDAAVREHVFVQRVQGKGAGHMGAGEHTPGGTQPHGASRDRTQVLPLLSRVRVPRQAWWVSGGDAGRGHRRGWS